MQAGEIRIDRLGPSDWRAYRVLRLEALRHEPNAFTSTYADALTRPDAWWRNRLTNPRSVMLMARVDGEPAGIVGLHLESNEGDPSVGIVNGMYVSRRYRRRGVGRRLLQALIDLVAEHLAIATLRLWVTATEEPARRLYASLGFRLVPSDDPSAAHDTGGRRLLIMERPAQTISTPRAADR